MWVDAGTAGYQKTADVIRGVLPMEARDQLGRWRAQVSKLNRQLLLGKKIGAAG